MLEVIDKGACSHDHPVPLLFVHGAWHAAWCWDEHFLPFFADNGYRALAVSLRGHGSSPTSTPLRKCSIADYVDDVASVAASLPTPPVVLGHSMGGFIVQKYLETHPAPAGVLLASSPPEGLRAVTLRIMRRYPWATVKSAFSGDTRAIFGTPERSRLYMFSPTTPESLVAGYTRRFQQESRRALWMDAMFRDLPNPARVSTQMLVMGGGSDGSFTPAEIGATARAYGSAPELFARMGHDMMLEPGWQSVAERIDSWLVSRGL
jgi:pimeloyl-ACP methyl ester carboxylesterase